METRRGHACANGMLFTDCHVFVSQNCEYLSQRLAQSACASHQYTTGHFSILLGTSVYYYRHFIKYTTGHLSICSSYHPTTKTLAVIEYETEAKPRSSNSITANL